ncbi:MAG: Bax inhibitor-1 family protein [Candidatus Thermoplasmatota archaeon]|nr:Bax inhibitor-1 family protein [Candidatus Thermoplasmatota archaeon]
MYTENAFESGIAAASARSEFIRKTYLNLALAFVAFIGVEALLMSWQPAVEFAARMVNGGNWLIVLLAFMGVSWLANSWALSAASLGKQYAGLYLYVVAEAVIFLPLLLVAESYAPDTIPQAAILTAALSGGITAYVFITKKDFSYLGTFLVIGSFVALGLIVCAVLFGFSLGLWFSAAMVVFAGIAVLYQTSAVLHQYQNSQYVAAALGLFAAIALMFWYILQILMGSRR